MSDPAPLSEFCRRVELSRLGNRVAIYPIVASAEERLALARRFDLLALDHLEAEVQLQRMGERSVRLEGRLVAKVVQACVVTLEPVANELAERFTVLFGAEEPRSRVVLEPEGEIVEPIDGDSIDIGEAVVQQLASLLDPYPRAAGAYLEAPYSDGVGC